MDVSPDILVIGLGPAGACAARSAALTGCTVMALERKKTPGHPVQCAEFVPALIGTDVDGLKANTVQDITAMLTQVEGEVPDLMENFPGRMIDRAHFDAALAHAAQRAGADCHYGQSVRAIKADGTVVLASGEAITPKVIIGADGPHSLAGRAVGSINEDILETRQICVPLRTSFQSTDIFLKADIRGGYGWLFPKGDVANLGVGVMAADKAALKAVLAALHDKLVKEGRVGDEIINHTGGAIPAGGMLRPFGLLGKTLVLLAGDAAGLTNPVTGAGINAAVMSGGLAGAAAADWLDGDKIAPHDYHQDLKDVFGASLARALRRRRDVLQTYDNENTPTPGQLRAGWIAYPDYWAA